MAFLFHDWIPWLHILCVTCIIFSSKISINIFIKLFWYAWWHMDRAAVRETQHGNHATQMCPLAHWATTYIQQTVHNVTAIFTSLATETQPQQMWRTVTAIYTRLPAETWWQQFFRRLSNCDALSQVISLVLLTASLELLGFGIRPRQAISSAMCYLSRRWDAYLIGLLIGEHLRYRLSPPGKRAMARC